MTDTIEERALKAASEYYGARMDHGLTTALANALTAFAKDEVGRVLEMAAETCEGLADEPAPSRGVQRSTILRSAARAIRALQSKEQQP